MGMCMKWWIPPSLGHPVMWECQHRIPSLAESLTPDWQAVIWLQFYCTRKDPETNKTGYWIQRIIFLVLHLTHQASHHRTLLVHFSSMHCRSQQPVSKFLRWSGENQWKRLCWEVKSLVHSLFNQAEESHQVPMPVASSENLCTGQPAQSLPWNHRLFNDQPRQLLCQDLLFTHQWAAATQELSEMFMPWDLEAMGIFRKIRRMLEASVQQLLKVKQTAILTLQHWLISKVGLIFMCCIPVTHNVVFEMNCLGEALSVFLSCV